MLNLASPILNLPKTETVYEYRAGTYAARTPAEMVFEYRSRRLVSGVLDEDGNFLALRADGC